MSKLSPDAFIAALAPQAIRARQDGSPLFPSVRLAQNILETGFRLHPWNNLGGIKAGGGRPNPWWSGRVVNKGTWEVGSDGKRFTIVDSFRAYDSVYDFYRDQDRLLSTERYKLVRAAGTPEEQARALQAGGYATDPRYAEKLIGLIGKYGLKKYDRMEVEEPMTAEEKKAFDSLQATVERLTDAIAERNGTIAAMAERLERLEKQLSLDKPPAWAEAAVQAAAKAGLIDTPEGGSLTFYRLLAVLHRAGVLGK